MRVLIYGECEQYGSGAWCYFETLKEMGHEVSYFSPTSILEQYENSFPLRLIRKLRKGKVLKKHAADHGRLFLEEAISFKPEIVVVLKGLMIDKWLIKKLKANKSWVVLINHDDFFSEFAYNTSTILLNAVPEYDYVFCTKEVNVGEIKKYNPNVEMFMFAYYPKIHYPPTSSADDQKQWQSDIVFVGNSYPLRTKQLEYLVTHIDQPLDLKIYGPNWSNKISASSPLRKFLQHKSLGPDEMRLAIYYSKISLGFLCKENRDDYTQRTFEIPACKGVLLAERTIRHSSFYKEDVEAMFFDSFRFDELVTKTKFLLSNPLKAEATAEEGYKRVTSSLHTYRDRLNRLFQLHSAWRNSN
ncbi:MAG: glycosyltransferase [Agriterribacter sp.]